MCPLFSIQSFDKNKAPPTLLFAIYFCAYQFSKEQHVELSEYMEKLAVQNIKKLVRKASVDNVRALIIHTFIAQLGGKLSLAKSLQAHLTRVSYLLGVHLDCSKLCPITHFNRDQVLCAVRNVNLGLSGSNNFSPNYLTEFGKEECDIYSPKWQLPNPSSPIYFENPLENQLYSLCLIEFYKYTVNLIKTIYFPSFSKLEKNTFNRIWHSKVSDLKTNHESILQALNELKTSFADYGANVEPFKTQVKMTYYNAVIDMYEILKHKNESFKPREVSSILDICHELYQVHISASNYNPYFQLYSHIIGFHYLNVYPKCTPTEKVRTKQRLQDLILFMKDKFSSHFSLNYLILKAGYDAINDG
ncbi:hypothetical protein CONCODRAFT_78991 [Conidiobolus coronatus NRRL 28638]|uniref:Transcription factor domain-containing protein n=1 Tax=Conidiobolus coronatus (strain ATCC 28846 / CBS 209.66 / NRRL 28638) TaxID=796925 RepID=A0A137P5H1_CONC2|nr:hypothetical protein CONCODRAFT_78991 [Conidiobolus coronatus NRRL 28638]|eukprot:KXN70171.1 hypothetical protein CONCODRAFT_78991 [Conidiobolus coronatus NRRL 28638]